MLVRLGLAGLNAYIFRCCELLTGAKKYPLDCNVRRYSLGSVLRWLIVRNWSKAKNAYRITHLIRDVGEPNNPVSVVVTYHTRCDENVRSGFDRV